MIGCRTRLHCTPNRPVPAHPPSVARQTVGLVAALAVTYAAASIGGLAAIDAPAFYAQLDRPSWAPPAWLFGPAWSVLYTLMAIAVWWVWRAAGWPLARPALGVYAAQLLANALWSWLFFAWRQGSWAFVGSVALWALVAATLVVFWRLHRPAGLLLLPYLAWVSYATALTWSVWQRNPALLGP